MISIDNYTKTIIKNNNIPKYIKLSGKSIFYIKQFFELIQQSNTFSLIKHEIYDVIPSKINLTPSLFMDERIISNIKQNLSIGYKYIFKTNDRTIHLNFFSSSYDKIYDEYYKLIHRWLNIITKFSLSNCSKNLYIDIYLTDLKKEFNGKNITPFNVNSGYTTGGCKETNNIVIYRKQEWFKVLIHETIHAFAIDFSYINNTLIDEHIRDIFPLNISFNSYEAYCEAWSVIWNSLFHSFNIEMYDFNLFIKQFRIIYTIECIFSYQQMITILNHMNLDYINLYSKDVTSIKKRELYHEDTSIISYFVFKTILIQNINKFFTLCENNTNLMLFNTHEDNILSFVNFFKKNYLHFPFKNNIQINKKYIRFILYDFS